MVGDDDGCGGGGGKAGGGGAGSPSSHSPPPPLGARAPFMHLTSGLAKNLAESLSSELQKRTRAHAVAGRLALHDVFNESFVLRRAWLEGAWSAHRYRYSRQSPELVQFLLYQIRVDYTPVEGDIFWRQTTCN